MTTLVSGVGNQARYEIRFCPEWQDIELIRASVGFCVSALVDNTDAREAVPMVTAELLENAIKHGDRSNDIHILLTLTDSNLVLRVSNRIVGSAEELIRIIDWIDGFDEPREAYLARLNEIYASTNGQVGGLGLTRVAYEGNCVLSAGLVPDSQNRVQVEAQFRPFEDQPAGEQAGVEADPSPTS